MTAVRYHTSPVGTPGGKLNWVDKTGGLDPFLRAIAHALIRERGMSESHAIATAVAICKRWASGAGHVSAETRAKAAAAIADWEAKKAASHAKSAGRAADLRTATAQLRTFDPAQPRGKDGKWSLEGLVKAVAKAAKTPDAGATIHPLTGEHAKDGVIVAVQHTSHIARIEDIQDPHNATMFLVDFLDAKREMFRSGDHWIGMWHDPGHHEMVLDVSDKMPDAGTAETEGRARNQQGVYDVGNDHYINTGGSGDRDTAVRWSPPPTEGAARHEQGRDVRGVEAGGGGVGASRAPPAAWPGQDRPGRRGETSSDQVAALRAATAGLRHRGPHLPVQGGHANTPTRRARARRVLHDRHVTTVETEMTTALKGLFVKQASATVSRLTGNRGRQMMRATQPTPEMPPKPGPPPILDAAAVFDTAHWTAETAQLMRNILSGVASYAPASVDMQLGGSPPGAEKAARSVFDFINSRANQLAGQVTDDTYRQITDALNAGIAHGEGTAQLAARVKAVFAEAGQVRAERIARTETHAAVIGAQDSYTSALGPDVIAERRWLCVAAVTRVASMQPVEVVKRRRAAGWMTTIRTPRGGFLSVTPNHPVLTDRGWIPAYSLDVGDNLIRHSRFKPEAWPDVDVQDMPPKADEVFRSAALTGPDARVVRAVPDLYSDPINCEVEVVPVDATLALNLIAPFGEPTGQRLLELTAEQLESFACSGDLLLHDGGSGEGTVPPLGLDDLGATSRFQPREVLDSELPSLRVAAADKPAASQLVVDGDRTASEPVGDRGGRLTREVGGDHGVPVDVQSACGDPKSLRRAGLLDGGRVSCKAQPCCVANTSDYAAPSEPSPDRFRRCAEVGRDLPGGFAGEVAADEIVHVETGWVSTGHDVYDLTTMQGWFVANGFIVHNSTPDARTRETHRAADGQTRTVGEPFTVGGASLKYPGDPSAPPAEVIGCRCVVLYQPT